MKCINCGENEATYSCDCLKVNHDVSVMLSRRSTREQADGIERVGLCDKCRKKLIWKNRTNLSPGKIYGIGILIFVFGLILGCAGTFNSANGGGSETLQTAGLVIALVPCLFIIVYDFIVAPAKLKKTPYKVIGHIGPDAAALLQEGKHDIYVPLGDGFYKDEKDFARVNKRLSEDIRKQIYEKLVKTGAWKFEAVFGQMGYEPAGSSSGDLPTDCDSGDLLTDSVNRLLALYRQRPGGFLTSQAGEVREVGRQLDKAGGMDMMLQAHSMFRARNPGMARNLEMVWDGIGGWMG